MKNTMVWFVLCFFLSCFRLHAQTAPEDYGNNSQAGHYAMINGIRLYYEVYGQGEPLLMLHGNGGSIAAFSNQIPFFEQYYQVIAVDSRLQGKSGGSPYTISYELMAADFCALLDYLKLDSVNVLGWSDGGINGLLMALKCPGKVKRLAVSGANVQPDTTAFSQTDILNMENFVKYDTTASPVVIALNKMMLTQPHIAYGQLAKIHCPVLVMAGDQDVIKPEHTLKIFRSIPGASLCIFPNSNHGVCQQHPQLFNETVYGFLRQ